MAIWQMFGPSAWLGLALLCASLALFGMLPQSGSRLRIIVHMAAITTLVGFYLIAFRSRTVAQPALGIIWIADFYGRIETVENISARDVFRLRLATRPDILVTGDGKHMALVSPNGEVALLRGKAGDFIRGMIFEKAGSNAKAIAIEDLLGVKCTLDNCVIALKGRDRPWILLPTRTFNPIPSMEMAAASKRVDIAVSDRWLPQSCRPKWIKADRQLLEQTGGLAIYLKDQNVITANEKNRHSPWVQAAIEARATVSSNQ